jgi:hypothetical protein
MSDTHPRTLIRQEVVNRLKACKVVDGAALYATPAGDRVFPARALPSHVKLMPALLVYDDKEKVQGEYFQDCPKRVVTCTVEAQATAADEEALDLLLDAMALVVERIVLFDPRQGGNAQGTSYSATEKSRDDSGDRLFGWLWLDFEIEYDMPPLDETSGMDDFLLFHADYDLAPQDGSIETSDDIRVRPEES